MAPVADRRHGERRHEPVPHAPERREGHERRRVYHGQEFDSVWSGTDKHQLISGDYARYPDHLSSVAPDRSTAPRQAAPVVTHPCACGCGTALRAGVTWAKGHHQARHTKRGHKFRLRA